MRSSELREVLTRHLEAVAARLQAELESGAEVPFELEQRGGRTGGRQPALYCYRPLSAQFIAEREHDLQALPSYREAAFALADFEGLERYLMSAGLDVCPAAGGARVRAALSALVREVFREQSDFELRGERLERVLSALERTAQHEEGEVCLLATLHGLAIVSQELELTS